MDGGTTAYEPDDEIEARALERVLQAEGIAYSLVTRGEALIPGVGDRSGPWGQIRVAHEDLEAAQAVIADWLEAEVDVPPGGPFRQPGAEVVEDLESGSAADARTGGGTLLLMLLLLISVGVNIQLLWPQAKPESAWRSEDDLPSGRIEYLDPEGRLTGVGTYSEGSDMPRRYEAYDVDENLSVVVLDEDEDGWAEEQRDYQGTSTVVRYLDQDEDGHFEYAETKRDGAVVLRSYDRNADDVFEEMRLVGGVRAQDLDEDGFPELIECRQVRFDARECTCSGQ